MKHVTGVLFGAQIPSDKLELSDDGLAPLEVNDVIVKLVSYGPFLLGKGLAHHHMWMYFANKGTFVGPETFDISSDAALALAENEVLAFDESDLKEKNLTGVLRKVLLGFDKDIGVSGKILVDPQDAKVENLFLKNRVQAELARAMGRLCVGAQGTSQGCLGWMSFRQKPWWIRQGKAFVSSFIVIEPCILS